MQELAPFPRMETSKGHLVQPMEGQRGQALVEFVLVTSVVMVGLLAVFELTDFPGTLYAGLKSIYLDLSSLFALPFP